MHSARATIGSYTGTTAYGFTALGEGTTVQVTADGNWSVTLAPMSSAPAIASSGAGDAAFLYDGAAGKLAATHNGSRNFVVSEQTGDAFSFGLLVNEISAYSSMIPLSSGPSVISVNADGAWTLTGAMKFGEHPSIHSRKTLRGTAMATTTPETETAPPNFGEKASAQLLKTVGKVIDTGIGPLTGSVSWAEDRLARIQGDRYVPNADPTRKVPASERDDVEKAIKRLIVESVEAAGVNGFVTGLGGFIAMPVTIPANMAGALVINARLAAAIAYLRGYDPKDPHVRTVATLTAVGSNAQQILKAVGIKVGEKVAFQAIKNVPIAVIREINKKAGFMLLAKYGTTRPVITLAKGVPLVGGVVGGAVDATMTTVVGHTAKAMFPVD